MTDKLVLSLGTISFVYFGLTGVKKYSFNHKLREFLMYLFLLYLFVIARAYFANVVTSLVQRNLRMRTRNSQHNKLP